MSSEGGAPPTPIQRFSNTQHTFWVAMSWCPAVSHMSRLRTVYRVIRLEILIERDSAVDQPIRAITAESSGSMSWAGEAVHVVSDADDKVGPRSNHGLHNTGPPSHGAR